MIVAISQPEHFPYLGYFQKMARADIFVLLDSVKFQGRGSFQVRNWFINTHRKHEWFTMRTPKSAKHLQIRDVPVLEGASWQRAYCEKLRQNMDIDVTRWFEQSLLVDFNIQSIEYGRTCFGIETPMVRSHELDCEGGKSELIASICRELGATTYLCGPGGMGYLDHSCFEGIDIKLFEPNVPDHQTFLAHRYRGLWD